MKTTFSFLFMMILSVSIFAQNIEWKDDDQKVQTIFNSVDIWRVSGFGGSTMSFTSVAGESALITGGAGGVILNNFLFGGYGESTTNEVDITNGEGYSNLNFGHGGFLFGYEFQPRKMVHPVFTTKLGWGNINTRNTSINRLINDNVFVVVPTVSAEVNFTRFFKVNLGLEYRRTFGVNKLEGLSNNDFSSAGVFASFVFGWF